MGRILIPNLRGISVASTNVVSINVLGFTLTKNEGDGNLIYCFNESYTTPPRPSVFYGRDEWDYDSGTGNRAILAFNTTATYYASNQSWYVGNISLLQNRWYLITFQAGVYDDGSIPSVPNIVYVNSSSDPTTIPTSGWSPAITITAASAALSNKISIKKQNLGGGKLNLN